MTAPLIQIAGLSKRFGATVALNNVSFDIAPGSVVALMGANGAGKSTLVKILCGVHGADSGSLAIAGNEIRPRSPREARTFGIIAVHQSIADVGVPGLSVGDNLLLDRYCARGSRFLAGGAADRAAAAAMAASVGLTIDLDRRLDSLSIADRQLVAIARAVAERPRLMIFDEPTASLSAPESERLFQLIERLRSDGVAILYISHKIADLRRLADTIVVLRDGRLAAKFEAPLDIPAAIRTMVGRDVGVARRAAGATGKPVLNLTGVRLRPHDAPFDLSAAEGEVLAVTGPVGAGKTSLAGVIFGLWRAAAGTMSLDDRPWAPNSPSESVARGVFMAGEDRWRTSFFPSTVPFANIAGTISFPFLPRWASGGLVRPAVEQTAAERLIRSFGIKAQSPRDPLTALSGGNQQKVVLARWHAEPARLLLLDEPFQGVDIGARDDIIAAIRTSSAGRATIVFVNDLEEALEVGDRVVAMTGHTIGGEQCDDTNVVIDALTASSPSHSLLAASP